MLMVPKYPQWVHTSSPEQVIVSSVCHGGHHGIIAPLEHVICSKLIPMLLRVDVEDNDGDFLQVLSHSVKQEGLRKIPHGILLTLTWRLTHTLIWAATNR